MAGQRIDIAGDSFVISYPPAQGKLIIPALAVFPRRRYLREPAPHWVVPSDDDNARALLVFAEEFDFEVTDAARALYASAAEPAPRALPWEIIPDREVIEAADFYRINFKFDVAVFEAVRDIPDARPRQDTQGTYWIISKRHASAVWEFASQHGFRVPEALRVEVEREAVTQAATQERENRKRRALALACADLRSATFGGKRPRDYQIVGVSWMIDRIFADLKGCILADDMGLGKTMSSMLVARAFQRAFGCEVIVLSPANLIGTWKEEAAACHVYCEVHSQALIPAPNGRPFVLICDEAHSFQNFDAMRTRKMLTLASSPHCLFVLQATGTPMRGARPANLFPLLRSIGHPLGLDKLKYEKTYCDGQTREYYNKALETAVSVWDAKGASSINQLKTKISNAILRRLKKDVATELPEKTRIKRRVELSDEAHALYQQAYNEARESYFQRLRQGLIKDGAEALALMTHIRRAASIAKVEATTELNEEVIEQGGRPVIFTDFVESAERIAEHFRRQRLTVELLTGKTHGDRKAMEQRFQRGESRVWVSTIKSGGLGLTLTASDYGFLHDRPWIVDDAIQAEDRLHRIGQRRAVTVVWVQALPIDLQIDRRLEEQRATAAKIEAGDDGARMRSVHELAKEVAAEMFGSDQTKAAGASQD